MLEIPPDRQTLETLKPDTESLTGYSIDKPTSAPNFKPKRVDSEDLSKLKTIKTKFERPERA